MHWWHHPITLTNNQHPIHTQPQSQFLPHKNEIAPRKYLLNHQPRYSEHIHANIKFQMKSTFRGSISKIPQHGNVILSIFPSIQAGCRAHYFCQLPWPRGRFGQIVAPTTHTQGRRHGKKLLFFWILSKSGGGGPCPNFLSPFHKCILVNKRSLFPPKCQ